MNSQSVFTRCLKTGLFFTVALFFVHGQVQAADGKTPGSNSGEPCQLTPVEEIRRCDNALDQQKAVNPSAQEKKIQQK